MNEPVWVWGLPLAPLKLTETVEAASALVEKGEPAFFITANTHYAMLTRESPDLNEVNARAAVHRRRWSTPRLGCAAESDPAARASGGVGPDLRALRVGGPQGLRLFFVGGAPGVAALAARRLTERFPGLQVVGTASPSFRDFSTAEHEKLKAQIGATQPHILIVAATMPLGERWLASHLADLGVALGVNLGASIDFAAGRIHRAPRWMQKAGLEWAFRLMLEPRRLFSRYARNAWFICSAIIRDFGAVPANLG